MESFDVSLSSFWIVAIMICLILLVLAGQVSHFSAKFKEARRDEEANLIGLAGQLKKMQSTLSEQLGEQRRMVRMLNELLALKQAEMTGDFEIVEEPIAPAAPPPQAEEKKAEPAELPKAPSKFPGIEL